MHVQPHSQPNELPIKKVNNYFFALTDIIGQGFSSKVYRGQHSQKQFPVAIKAIQLKKITNEVEKELLNNEVQVLNTVQHPNILKVHEIYQTQNNLYIVSQLCEQNLAELVKRNGPLRQVEALEKLTQIVSAFEHLTQFGILHRDVKPSNILLSASTPTSPPKIKLADFGFSYLPTPHSPSKPFYNVGSPKYMSPQSYKKTQYSEKSDMWGVGLIYLQMLNGRLPFESMDYDQMIKRIATGVAYGEMKISGFSKMILSRMLSVDVDRRVGFAEIKRLLLQENERIGVNGFRQNKFTEKSQEKVFRQTRINANPTNVINSLANINNNNTTHCIKRTETYPSNKETLRDKQNQRQRYLKPSLYDSDGQLRRSSSSLQIKRHLPPTSTNIVNHTNLHRNSNTPTHSVIPTPKYSFPKQSLQPSHNFKLQSLLKIISTLHADPCLRLNPSKIRLLKLVYTLATQKLKLQLSANETSAQLSNLQIILSGYGYIEFEEVAMEDAYFQYIKEKIIYKKNQDQQGHKEEERLIHSYIDFWVIGCVKVYRHSFAKEDWGFKDMQRVQEAKDVFLALQRLLEFHKRLAGMKTTLQKVEEVPQTLQGFNQTMQEISLIEY